MKITTHDFLASTVNGLFLIENGKAKKLFNDSCYGLTWNIGDLFLASWNNPTILIFNESFEINKTIPFQFRIDDAHQILWYKNSLYVTNTGHNRIDVWKNGVSVSYQWLPITKNGEQAYDHINSIWCDGNKFYVDEHRRGRLPIIIRTFDLDFVEIDKHLFSNIRTDHLNGLHNVYVENENLFTLSVNNLIIKNLTTQKDTVFDIRSHQDIGYLRGFARNKTNFYIGESCISEKEDRRKGDSNIIILDNDYEIEEIITIKNSGQLHDIRLLKNDYAHNMLPCPRWVYEY